MRRVLLVSPHFPPVNAPDMQRARLALPYLRELGWSPTVLAVSPERVEGAVLDPLLAATYPAEVPVLRVGGVSPRLTRPLGFGSLWWRCGHALRRAGDALLATQPHDLVFFTTTQFDAFTLGPRWRQRFGVPYALDYQDPWVNTYYRRAGVRPPGGPLRYWFSQYTARRREPAVVRGAGAILSVSSAYVPDLLSRYPGLDPDRLHHLPFGASAADLELARTHRPAKPLVNFDDGHQHLVYAGRCGPDMTRSLTLLFRAFRRQLERCPEQAARLRFHFIGTDYAPPPLGRYWALPIAEQEGVAPSIVTACPTSMPCITSPARTPCSRSGPTTPPTAPRKFSPTCSPAAPCLPSSTRKALCSASRAAKVLPAATALTIARPSSPTIRWWRKYAPSGSRGRG
jgi:hypothetical protein